MKRCREHPGKAKTVSKIEELGSNFLVSADVSDKTGSSFVLNSTQLADRAMKVLAHMKGPAIALANGRVIDAILEKLKPSKTFKVSPQRTLALQTMARSMLRTNANSRDCGGIAVNGG